MNLKQLYIGFMRAKYVYGHNPIHVQLVARQMNVLAGEVVDFILANPTYVSTRYISPNENISNIVMGNEYAGLYVVNVTPIAFISTVSVIREGDSGGTITLAIENDTFTNSTITSNWTIDAGNTGLTLASVDSGTTSKILTFTGTTKTGVISIQCKDSGLTGAGKDSDVLYLTVEAKSLDFDTLSKTMAEIGVPVLAVAANKNFTLSVGLPTDGETVTIAGVVYTFKSVANMSGTPAGGQIWVSVSTTFALSATNLFYAITGGTGVGTNYKYGEGTIAHPTVTATNPSGGVVTATAKTAGVSGNLIAIAELCANGLWAGSATFLSGGINGTPVKAGKIFLDGTSGRLWIAKADTTISDTSGWKYITFTG